MDIPHSVVVQVRDRVGFVSLKTLDEAISGPVHEFFGFMRGRMQECSSEPRFVVKDAKDIAPFVEAAQKWLREVRNPPVRTELTVKNVHKWAKDYVKANPTRVVQVWSEGKFVDRSVKNSTALVLADILHSIRVHEILHEDRRDLFETLRDALWDGLKGLKDYTVQEALKEIESECIGPNAHRDFHDLEDMLESWGPGADLD